jgi:hypothetical protein
LARLFASGEYLGFALCRAEPVDRPNVPLAAHEPDGPLVSFDQIRIAERRPRHAAILAVRQARRIPRGRSDVDEASVAD